MAGFDEHHLRKQPKPKASPSYVRVACQIVKHAKSETRRHPESLRPLQRVPQSWARWCRSSGLRNCNPTAPQALTLRCGRKGST